MRTDVISIYLHFGRSWVNIAANGIALANHLAKLTKHSSHLGLPILRPVFLEHSQLPICTSFHPSDGGRRVYCLFLILKEIWDKLNTGYITLILNLVCQLAILISSERDIKEGSPYRLPSFASWYQMHSMGSVSDGYVR